jgi:tight adherence protein C
MGVLRRRRARAIRQNLPVAMDLLEIGVSAGATLDGVWNEVAEQIRPVCPPLADEMVLVSLERRLGVPRPDALREMVRRTGVDDVQSLVGLLVQSQRYGTGVSEALRIFADTMRDTHMQRAEEAAEKLSVKLSVPMIVFVFPAVLIVAGGPGVMALMGALAQM